MAYSKPKPKPAGIRAFIGLPIPKAAQEILEDTQFDLMEFVPENSVRWTNPSNMHLTLFFLGDGILPEKIAQLCDTLDDIAATCQPFALELGLTGCFPKQNAPRVLWVGVNGQTRSLNYLKRQTDDHVIPLGWEPEQRRYTPHLTLGYVQDIPAVGRSRLPYNSPVSSFNWTVDQLHLYHSQRTKKGMKYTKIHTSMLK